MVFQPFYGGAKVRLMAKSSKEKKEVKEERARGTEYPAFYASLKFGTHP
jgi:hypothetical protein